MNARSDRAQLILVGAVAIAIIVLGLAVVFNTVLYTENVASTGAASAPRDAEVLDEELMWGSARLIDRVNANGTWTTDDQAYDALEQNISQFSSGLTEVTGRNTPALATVEDGSQADAVYAARINYEEESEFTNVAGVKNWSMTVGSPGSPVIVRNFDMVIDANSLGDENKKEAFRVVWQDPSQDDTYTLWIYENGGPDGDVAIRTLTDDDTADPVTDFGDGSDECVLSGTSGSEVAFNISDGQIRGFEGCSQELDVSEGIPDGELRSVEFYRGDNVTGEYSMVIWREDPNLVTDDLEYVDSGITDPGSAPLTDPYWTFAVWKFDMTTSYNSRSVSFEKTSVVEVYNRSR